MLRAGMRVSDYVRRGDRERRRARWRYIALSAGFLAAVALLVTAREAPEAEARPSGFSLGGWSEARRLGNELENARGELAIAGVQLARYEQMFRLAARYEVPARLAEKIHDAAVRERIEPELAFRVVKIESDFKENAVSPVGAIGLTQLMLNTARDYERNVTREQLFEPERNLRIGFRYLRGLVEEYKDVRIALLVYNRGPAAVQNARAAGLDPSNGYEHVVMRGYRGRGVID
ncbi:MAG: transglycosylase SLT domain-containing protein [Gemmatimonadetes bacterium]|nr:transglycosylase SLT domain-containing protein [Gemmatimonadota bacterium]